LTNLREFRPSDISELKEIHSKHFSHEFTFPDFLSGYLCAFTALDDEKGEIVVAGGVRTIAELVIVTDKSKTGKIRRDALYKMLEASAFVASKTKYDQLHAFVQDERWESILKRVGFVTCKGNALCLSL